MPASAPAAGTAAQPAEAPAQQAAPGTGGSLTLLVIEDDPAGVVSVPRMLDAYGKPVRVRTARNLTEAARLLTDDVHCILLDLALPCEDRCEERPEGRRGEQPEGRRDGVREERPEDRRDGPREERGSGEEPATAGDRTAGRVAAQAAPAPAVEPSSETPAEPDELHILRRVLRMAPRHAVLALTDGSDAERAADAVRVGAQDYLFRDELDGRLLTRAIRYAVARKRADLAQRQLTETRLRAQENARLERGLLPRPILEGSELRFAARYRPGRSRALLGGDFYDTVRTPDGTVHAMIGDVCGHGPDEAALGVELRIAWRALTFAGLCGDALLSTLQKVLENERASEEIFATLCTVDISPDGRSAGICLAGHPSPLFAGGAGAAPRLLPYDESGPALGLLPHARWPRRQVTLGRSWSLMMYTDGLIEGRVDEGRTDSRERLGQHGMLDIVSRRLAEGASGERLLEATMTEVRRLNGGELTDDVAVLLLDRSR
ncbi:fused response regulator/phosphatase [Streptomyces tubbatahanensis]|uniref:Fused response regulator/phosphatase n=1 Tax=Streptomyces tubbatahanensis TaxID=2923272 RepID=A0ABY3XTN7_9ACTN|nr:fused response regulator/phosphatase [Streptomyces tubbatahanensis]UNS97730.1 fused response regulator/phosphatase [Streptomyces tubbatahanensis]